MIGTVNAHEYDESQERRQEGSSVTQEDIDRIENETDELNQLHTEAVTSKELNDLANENSIKEENGEENGNANENNQENLNKEDNR